MVDCSWRLAVAGVCLAQALGLTGCGGGGGSGGGAPAGGPAPTTSYTIGGTVSGLASGASVVLMNNGGDGTTVSSNTNFSFSHTVASGSGYAVTVSTNPAGQPCSVANGSGVATANVTNVAVSCTTTSTGGGSSGGGATVTASLMSVGGRVSDYSSIIPGNPSAGIDQAGQTMALYAQGYPAVAYAVTGSVSTGNWATPVKISPASVTVVTPSAGLNVPSNTVLAVDGPTGDAAAAFVGTSADHPLRNSLWIANYRKSTNTWSAASFVGYASADSPRLMADDHGHFALVWIDVDPSNSANVALQTVVGTSGAAPSWTAPASTSLGTSSASLAAAVLTRDSASTLGVAWSNGTVIHVSRTSLTQASSDALNSPQSFGPAGAPSLSDDLRFLAYRAYGSGNDKINVHAWGAGGYGAAQSLAAGTYNLTPLVATSANGSALLTFFSGFYLYYSTPDGSGVWHDPIVADGALGFYVFNINQALALDDAGNGLMVGHGPTGSEYARFLTSAGHTTLTPQVGDYGYSSTGACAMAMDRKSGHAVMLWVSGAVRSNVL